MSFELFLQAFAQGQRAGIPAQAIRSAFGDALSEPEEDFWQVTYADDQSSDLFLTPLQSDLALIHNLSIDRPCADAGLYEAIWRLLGIPGTCLYFPGDGPPLARDPAIGSAMPRDLRDSLGEPALVRSPAEISLAVAEGQE